MYDRPTTAVRVIKRGATTSGFDIAVGLFLVFFAALMLLHLW